MIAITETAKRVRTSRGCSRNHRLNGLAPGVRLGPYEITAPGQSEVYVRPFPNVDGGRWQISTDGGDWLVCNPAGNELFYRGPAGVMALVFETEPTFTPGALTRLFERNIPGLVLRRMAVSPDGQRFLLLADAADGADSARSQLVVVQNFFEELRQRVPTP